MNKSRRVRSTGTNFSSCEACHPVIMHSGPVAQLGNINGGSIRVKEPDRSPPAFDAAAGPNLRVPDAVLNSAE